MPSRGDVYSGPSRSELGAGGPEDDDDDDAVGPLPLPEGYRFEDDNGVQQFREREERERKRKQEALEDKKPKREEWMLVPPKEMDLLSCEEHLRSETACVS